MDQKGNEERLVDVPPGEVIAAGQAIEFIAKIAVAVVEVTMEQEFGKGQNQNDQHAAG